MGGLGWVGGGGDGRDGWSLWWLSERWRLGYTRARVVYRVIPKTTAPRFIIHDCRKCFKVSQLAWRARRRTAGGSRVPGQKPHRHMLDMQTPTHKQKDPGRDWNLFPVNEHCAVVVLLIIEMWWCRHMGWTFVSKVGISIQKKNQITHNLKKHV